ncbi:MAG: hypothetical protein OXH68_15260 [Gammaproteobacteria bacterium]|nr:hypothetical protein [Gammaproteobacteria bacterium]
MGTTPKPKKARGAAVSNLDLAKNLDAVREVAESGVKRIEDLHDRHASQEAAIARLAEMLPGYEQLEKKVDDLAGSVIGKTELGRKLVASRVTVFWLAVSAFVLAEVAIEIVKLLL